MDNYGILERLRSLKINIDQLKDDYRHQIPTVQSPRMDGMPKTGNDAETNTAWVERRESLARRIKNMESEYRNKLKVADSLMKDMPHDLYRFCQCYYINAYDIDHTCIVLEFSRRTFYYRMKSVTEYMKDRVYNSNSNCIDG